MSKTREFQTWFDRSGERVYFTVHADNPRHQWTIRELFTIYHGRAQAYVDIYTLEFFFPQMGRDDAEFLAIEWLRSTDRID